jgi:hypothetical protein
VVTVALREGAGETIAARTFDRDLPAVGQVVHVSVAGPVVTYPEPPTAGAESGDRHRGMIIPTADALAGTAQGRDSR